MNEVLAYTHPVEFILLLLWITYLLKLMTADKVTTLNAISSQPWGMLILLVGFVMLLACKKFQIDTTIAGGVIGIGGNMLQGQIKHPPAGAAVESTITEKISTPPVPPASNPPTP